MGAGGIVIYLFLMPENNFILFFIKCAILISMEIMETHSFIHQIFTKQLLCTQTLIGIVQGIVPAFKALRDSLGKQADKSSCILHAM